MADHDRVEFAFAARDRQRHLLGHGQVQIGERMQRVIGGGQHDTAARRAFSDHHREMRVPHVDYHVAELPGRDRVERFDQMGQEPFGQPVFACLQQQ